MVKTMSNEDPFLEKAKHALDDSLDNINEETQARLNQARREALRAAANKESPAPWFYWGSAGGMVVAALVAFIGFGEISLPGLQPERVATDLATPSGITSEEIVETMDLLATDDALELMEDLEFVAWLMEQEEDHAG